MLGDLFVVEIDGHPVTVVCDANPVSGHGLSLTSNPLTLNYRPAFLPLRISKGPPQAKRRQPRYRLCLAGSAGGVGSPLLNRKQRGVSKESPKLLIRSH